MKTKVNMSKAALLIELGWEPINDWRELLLMISFLSFVEEN
jgi:hypothetical protein